MHSPQGRPSPDTSRAEVPSEASISLAFHRQKERGLAALVPYVCAGFPSRDLSLDLMIAAVESGADVLELGIPFSDPLADGPTIQGATFQALEHGMNVAGALEILADFRRTHETPVVLFTYLNPIHRFGLGSFVSAAREAGAQGLLVTDLPVGSDPGMESRLSAAGLDLIRLIAPTTEEERAHTVSEGASGFLYYISRTGVTGARELLRSGLEGEVSALRAVTDLPIAVGFGISTAEQAAVVADIADGVVVGSALLEAVSEGGVPAGGRFLASLRASMDRGRG